jgi:hypothetical protein
MKKILLFLFAISFLSINTQAQEVSFQQLEVKEGIVYKKGETNPYTGICIDRWENGFMMEVKAFRNGKLHGEKKSFYESGNLKTLQIYGMGEPACKESKWDEEGELLYGPGFSAMQNEYKPQYQDSPARDLDIENNGEDIEQTEPNSENKSYSDPIYNDNEQMRTERRINQQVLYTIVDVALNVGVLLLTWALYY